MTEPLFGLDDGGGVTADLWVTFLDVTVYGTPVPQGSKTAFAVSRKGADGGREFTGQASMVEGRRGPARAAFKAWREAVRAESLAAFPRLDPLGGPLRLLVTFVPSERPKSHPKRTETWPTARPDVDKLLRAVGDALTHVPERTRKTAKGPRVVPAQPGVIVGDSNIVDVAGTKRWPGQPAPLWMPSTPDRPGAHIVVMRRALP